MKRGETNTQKPPIKYRSKDKGLRIYNEEF